MPILTEAPGGGAGDAAGATLFLVAYGQIWEIISGMLSSPWTAESFGADEGKKTSFNRYLAHATVNGAGVSLIAAWVSKRYWPLVGSALGLGYAHSCTGGRSSGRASPGRTGGVPGPTWA